MKSSHQQTVTLTLLALSAFAANSLLARVSLAHEGMDPFSYTLIRLAAGAVTLTVTNQLSGNGLGLRTGWLKAVFLLLYALPFSLAYVRLSTGTGALIAFTSVQLTMLLGAVVQGNRPTSRVWACSGLALGGLLYLVLPGLSAPDPIGSAVMVLAGVGWGLYSLAGRSSKNALQSSANAFVISTALMIPFAVGCWRQELPTPRGLAFALFSGAVTSGLGYAIWYRALGGLTASQAALSQLVVPVIAALAGGVFLSEELSWRLLISSTVILGSLAIGLRKP